MYPHPDRVGQRRLKQFACFCYLEVFLSRVLLEHPLDPAADNEFEFPEVVIDL